MTGGAGGGGVWTAEVVHRLGVVLCVVAVAARLGLARMGRRHERLSRKRAASLLDVVPETARRPEFRVWAARWGAPVAAVATGSVLVGGWAGCALGLAAGYGVRRWQRTRSSAGTDEALAKDSTRELPLAAELLSACIAAGAGPREAAEAVGESLRGPVGDVLARVAAELRLGSEPAEAWGRFGSIPGAASLARCLERASATGAPAADNVARLAAGLRAERARAATDRASRAGVLITGPVGLCFLPAFLAVGVVPVVIGLATRLLQAR
ncbi:type II secretion system F family protein [Streptomyces sp. NBC_00388]|uniref:type II secretion system F family protein n=1 Tax=Streptomyces sp. NBC_00388 TaxID=2975735 RepID=UPI002E1C4FAE